MERGSLSFFRSALLFACLGCMGPAPRFEQEVGKGTNMWPLVDVTYDETGRETDILWPLFAFDNKVDYKYYAFRPLIMLETDPQHRLTSLDLVWPFFHLGRSGTRDEYALRPLVSVWRDPEKELLDIDFLFPFGWYRSDPEGCWFRFFPFLWYKRLEKGSGYWHFFPLFGRNYSPKKFRYWFLTPFCSYFRDFSLEPNKWSVHAFWPLIAVWNLGEERGSRFLPFYAYWRKSDSKNLLILPLYFKRDKFSSEDPCKVEKKIRLLFPFYFSLQDEGSLRLFGGNLLVISKSPEKRTYYILAPLICYSTDGAEKLTLYFVPPIFYYGRESEKDWSWNFLFPLIRFSRSGASYHSRVFPLFLYWKNPPEKACYLHLLWPLFRYVKRDKTRKWRLLLPFTSYWTDGKDHDFHIFWKWIRSSSKGGFKTLRINPFWREEKNARGDRYWSVLGGLVSHKKTEKEDSWRMFWVIPI